MTTWRACKKIVCVRPDNMGDLLMSSPAIRALKETFNCSITVLTSTMAKGIARYIPGVDDVIVWDAPWIKGTAPTTSTDFLALIGRLREYQFDGAVIFTVFSQNPLPAALMLTLAGIPNRLAYCRENPYHLLSDWVPDKEPYDYIQHQVRRDLALVKNIGAQTNTEKIIIHAPENFEASLKEKLVSAGVNTAKPSVILHPGVSEQKREYPVSRWIDTGKKLADALEYPLVITGSQTERELTQTIAEGIGEKAHALGGVLSLEEFITLIRYAPLLISVNTGSVHLAAALETRVIVLYALTNPQHAPWQGVGNVLPYSVPEAFHSRNEVLQFVQRKCFSKNINGVKPEEILQAATALLVHGQAPRIEELIYSTPEARLGNDRRLIFP